MSSCTPTTDKMAIGRHKSHSKMVTIITTIFLFVSLRLIWTSVRSMTTESAESKYPLENADFRLEDTHVVTMDQLIGAVNLQDLGDEITTKVMNRTDGVKHSLPTFSVPTIKHYEQEEFGVIDDAVHDKDIDETIEKLPEMSDEDGEKDEKIITVKSTQSQGTLTRSVPHAPKTTNKPHNTTKAEKEMVKHEVKNSRYKAKPFTTMVKTVENKQLPTPKVLKSTILPRNVVVHANDENVVQFTKEQLDYGNFVKNAEMERNSTAKPTIIVKPTTLRIRQTNEVTKDKPITKSVERIQNLVQNVKKANKLSSLFQREDLGHCQRVIPWGEPYHATISTFDLPSKGNYSVIDDRGNYPIPVRTIAEVTDPKRTEPVTVILVPFSHADPGYGLTIEQYYSTKTKATLDNMIIKLTQYPNMTFQWAETVYLARWFKDLHEDKKDKVRELIDRGQLEIVLGGWVMPDEASTRYVGVIDQLIEGHQWLIENLRVKPKTAWVNDPFGYSSTMPYLWKSSGMDNLLFLRINQAVKAQLMKMKAMDFKWRPYWKSENSSDVLSSVMAYTNYFIGDVCSPDKYRDVCNEFGFIHLDEKKHRAIKITEENLAKQAEKLYGMFRVSADLYKYSALYIGLGEDFSFSRAAEWDNLYKNYEKLMNYINTKSEWKMKIKFGNLSEYFNLVRTKEQEMSRKETETLQSFPTLSGDFFPYTEKNSEYWTGYYSTRPLNKRFSRELESLIHAADAFNVMLYSIFKYYNVKYEAYQTVAENLRIARRELGMFLHHDGITGTSLPHVVRDFEGRLMKAHESAQTAFKTIITTMLTKGKSHQPKLLQEETVKTGPRQISKKAVFQVGGKESKLVAVNPTARQRIEFVSVYVNTPNIDVKSGTFSYVPHQTSIMRDSSYGGRILLTFLAILPAFGMEVYKVVPTNNPETQAIVHEKGVGDDMYINNETFMIENPLMKVIFDKKTGMLREIHDADDNITYVTSEFMVYRSTNGGAYIFGPRGSAISLTQDKTDVTVTRGQFKSEVKAKFPGFKFSATIYNTTEIQGHGIHIRTEVDMKSVGLKNMDLIFRITTSTRNGPNFFTDQNGYQLIGRRTDRARKTESNYYPVTTMAMLEDRFKRVTMHCKQPHGAASLEEGQLEVMLDRHTNRDDGRGLGQGVYDNVNVNSDFILHIEYKDVQSTLVEARYAYPTQDAVLMNDALQNNLFIYGVIDNGVKLSDKVHPLKDQQLPCDVAVVGLRNLVKNNLDYNGTSLVLHRHSFQCGYQSKSGDCTNKENNLTVRNLLPKLKVKVTETTLSHLHVVKECNMDTDLRPKYMDLRSFKIDI